MLKTINRKCFKMIFGKVLIILVLLVLLLIQVLIGWCEAYKAYSEYCFDRINALEEPLKNSIEKILNAGIPLKYVQVGTIARHMGITEDMVKIGISDGNGFVLSVPDKKDRLMDEGYVPYSIATRTANNNSNKNSSMSPSRKPEYKVEKNRRYFRVDIPLKNKIQQAGTISVIVSREAISKKITVGFSGVYAALIIIIVLYSIFLFTTGDKWKKRWKLRFIVSFSLAFIVMMAVIVSSIISVYYSGIMGKTNGLANSLSVRLTSLCGLGLELNDFNTDLYGVFRDYIGSDKEIRRISLYKNGKNILSADRELKGSVVDQPLKPANSYMETTDISIKDKYKNTYEIKLYVYKNTIHRKLLRNIKNFLFLFISLCFIAVLFINLIISIRYKTKPAGDHIVEPESEHKIDLIKPLFFAATFAEGSIASFFPYYASEKCANIKILPNASSLLFVMYFLIFTLALYPFSRMVELKGEKSVCSAGFLAYSLSMLILICTGSWYFIFIARILAALGQAMILVCVQSYILSNNRPGGENQGSSIITFGFNAGMISGTALGALFLNYFEQSGVFMISGAVSLVSFAYIILFIPKKRSTCGKLYTEKKKLELDFFEKLKALFMDMGFLKSVFLVGIPSKMLLSGFVIFAMPIILAGYAKEDIGQIIMLYYGGVLISGIFSSRLVNNKLETDKILLIGMLLSGTGLLLIGADNLNIKLPFILLKFQYLMIPGITLLGVAHGFINAPINTHIIKTKAAYKIGQLSTSSFYRILERAGHISGPIVFGRILVWREKTPLALFYVGAAIIVLGMMFIINIGKNTVGTKSFSTGSKE